MRTVGIEMIASRTISYEDTSQDLPPHALCDSSWRHRILWYRTGCNLFLGRPQWPCWPNTRQLLQVVLLLATLSAVDQIVSAALFESIAALPPDWSILKSTSLSEIIGLHITFNPPNTELCEQTLSTFGYHKLQLILK